MPKLIRLSDFDAQHYVNTERYAVEVNKLFNTASLEFSVLASKLSVDPGKPFSFKDYPRTAAKAKEIAVKLNKGTVNLIQHGVEKQWLSSCKKNDAFIASILDTTKLPKKRLELMQDKNLEALKQFQDQKVGGLGLSERVWKTTSRFQKQIEVGLDTGIGDGRGAIEIASKLKQNLQYPDKLFHRVRDKHGALVASSAMKAFHPGRGVYKSSAKNAQRLTRTVINMGYRESDWLRWQSLDFVVGFEVKRTQRENKCSCPVCEALQGKYPKWFKWVGWHPQCMCYAVPILAAIEDMSNQMLADLRAALYGSEYGKLVAKNTVLDVPQAFKDWAHQNIDKSQGWRSVPYFVRDNFVDGSLLKGLNYPQETATRATLRKQRKEIKDWAKDNLVGRTIKHEQISETISFTVRGIKESLNQPHKHVISKNKAVKNIEKLLPSAIYVRTKKDSKGRNIEYHYLALTIEGEDSYIVLKTEENRTTFYSITDKLKNG